MCRYRRDAFHRFVARQRQHCHDVGCARGTDHGSGSPRIVAVRLGSVRKHPPVRPTAAVVLFCDVVSDSLTKLQMEVC